MVRFIKFWKLDDETSCCTECGNWLNTLEIMGKYCPYCGVSLYDK